MTAPRTTRRYRPTAQTLYFYWSPDLDLTPLQLLQGTTGVYVAHRTGGPGEFSYPTFLDLRRAPKPARPTATRA